MIPEKDLRRLAFQISKQYSRIDWGSFDSTIQTLGPGEDRREYVHGDDARHIDWFASARTADESLIVRTREADHHVNAVVVVDTPERSHWGGATANDRKTDVACFSAELIAHVLNNNQDTAGLLVNSNKPRFIQPSNGKRQLNMIGKALQDPVSTGSRTLTDLLSHNQLKRASNDLIFVISDLLSPGWEQALEVLAKRSEVVVLQVLDQWDTQMPEIGIQRVEVNGRKRRINTDDAQTRHQYNTLVANQQQERADFLKKIGATHHIMWNNADPIEQFVAMFSTQRTYRKAS